MAMFLMSLMGVGANADCVEDEIAKLLSDSQEMKTRADVRSGSCGGCCSNPLSPCSPPSREELMEIEVPGDRTITEVQMIPHSEIGDGGFRDLRRESTPEGRVFKVSVVIWCRSENKTAGAGAGRDYTMVVTHKHFVTLGDFKAAASKCAQGPDCASQCDNEPDCASCKRGTLMRIANQCAGDCDGAQSCKDCKQGIESKCQTDCGARTCKDCKQRIESKCQADCGAQTCKDCKQLTLSQAVTACAAACNGARDCADCKKRTHDAIMLRVNLERNMRNFYWGMVKGQEKAILALCKFPLYKYKHMDNVNAQELHKFFADYYPRWQERWGSEPELQILNQTQDFNTVLYRCRYTYMWIPKGANRPEKGMATADVLWTLIGTEWKIVSVYETTTSHSQMLAELKSHSQGYAEALGQGRKEQLLPLFAFPVVRFLDKENVDEKFLKNYFESEFQKWQKRSNSKPVVLVLEESSSSGTARIRCTFRFSWIPKGNELDGEKAGQSRPRTGLYTAILAWRIIDGDWRVTEVDEKIVDDRAASEGGAVGSAVPGVWYCGHCPYFFLDSRFNASW